MTLIKICGISDVSAMQAADASDANYIGFVFFEKSPRNLDLGAAEALALVCPERLRRIGLFVDPDDEFLARAVRVGRLNGIQLHGNETPSRVAMVKALFGVEVWKAIPVATRDDIRAASVYKGAADRLLFDAKLPKSAMLPGGMGVRFDWRLLEGAAPDMAWGLAGGLDASTVGDAIVKTGAPLVDVSSGVEERPGVKSPAMIREFCEAVRAV